MLKVFGRSIPTTVEEILTERAALVIWDMQWAIAGSATNLPMLLTTIPQLINSARARGHRIVYSQHFSPPFEYEDRAWIRSQWERSGRGDPSDMKVLYPQGSQGWQFIPEVAPTSSDLVIAKSRPNFFVSTPFRSVLAALGVDVVVMAGVATDRGVLTTWSFHDSVQLEGSAVPVLAFAG